jgi:hypothetical protein
MQSIMARGLRFREMLFRFDQLQICMEPRTRNSLTSFCFRLPLKVRSDIALGEGTHSGCCLGNVCRKMSQLQTQNLLPVTLALKRSVQAEFEARLNPVRQKQGDPGTWPGPSARTTGEHLQEMTCSLK